MSPSKETSAYRTVGFRAETGLIALIDEHAESLRRQSRDLMDVFDGSTHVGTINRSLALRSLCLHGLYLTAVPRRVLAQVYARSMAADHGVDEELAELLQAGLDALGEPLSAAESADGGQG